MRCDDNVYWIDGVLSGNYLEAGCIQQPHSLVCNAILEQLKSILLR